MPKGIKRQLSRAYEQVSRQVAAHAARGDRFSGGLASEGYNGGYRDALSDVLLALNGVRPNRNGWWDTPTEKGKQ